MSWQCQVAGVPAGGGAVRRAGQGTAASMAGGADAGAWAAWRLAREPEAAPLPGGWQADASPLQRLLLLRCLRCARRAAAHARTACRSRHCLQPCPAREAGQALTLTARPPVTKCGARAARTACRRRRRRTPRRRWARSWLRQRRQTWARRCRTRCRARRCCCCSRRAATRAAPCCAWPPRTARPAGWPASRSARARCAPALAAARVLARPWLVRDRRAPQPAASDAMRSWLQAHAACLMGVVYLGAWQKRGLCSTWPAARGQGEAALALVEALTAALTGAGTVGAKGSARLLPPAGVGRRWRYGMLGPADESRGSVCQQPARCRRVCSSVLPARRGGGMVQVWLQGRRCCERRGRWWSRIECGA